VRYGKERGARWKRYGGLRVLGENPYQNSTQRLGGGCSGVVKGGWYEMGTRSLEPAGGLGKPFLAGKKKPKGIMG